MNLQLVPRAAALAAVACTLLSGSFNSWSKPAQPNVVVILSDDVGYSDIGCYGGEIETPHLDSLAQNGVRFTQFYNSARCCPSRASLLTGLAPHQAGVGHMLHGNLFPGYADKLSSDCVTFAEVLKEAGYRTYMTGKWHVARSLDPRGDKAAWPIQRGFEKYYGIITGASNYFDPATLCRGNDFVTIKNDLEYQPDKYYFTDAITDNSLRFLEQHREESPEKPFLLYMAYTAAHWPLQAPEEEIARQKGRYDAGYDAIRQQRLEKMKKLGLIPADLQTSPTVGDWDKVEDKACETRQMETYAAMLHRMDAGIGKLVERLKADGTLENTIILYLQDNGGCAEEMWRDRQMTMPGELKPLNPDQHPRIMPPMQTRDGRLVRTGPGVMAGPEDTYVLYGEKWANVSNTPFREYKHWVHEGGISTPLVFHWPAATAANLKGGLVREPAHLQDIMTTLVDAAGTTYPAEYKGNKVAPAAGVSLLPLVQAKSFNRRGPIFWEHENNRAVRDGKWKLVTNGDGPWELYDIDKDRGEIHNLAAEHPELVKKMSEQWQRWAEANDVLPLGAWKTTMDEERREREQRERGKRRGRNS